MQWLEKSAKSIECNTNENRWFMSKWVLNFYHVFQNVFDFITHTSMHSSYNSIWLIDVVVDNVLKKGSNRCKMYWNHWNNKSKSIDKQTDR